MINNIKERLEEIENLKVKFLNEKKNSFLKEEMKNVKYQNGVSVIIPSYKSENVIMKCLNSLMMQTLSQNLFEVIIVINGEKDSTKAIVQDFIKKSSMKNIFITEVEEAGASLARNVGINQAKKKFVTFLDDDDYLSMNFLEEMYLAADTDTIAISQIVNVDINEIYDANNSINNEILNNSNKNKLNLSDINMVATINACKILPTFVVKEINYDTDLCSGEDIVFFTKLLMKYDWNFKIIPKVKEVKYYRQLTTNSVSRREVTFEFNVMERIAVIKKLDKLIMYTDEEIKKNFILNKIHAQSQFINKYLQENPKNHGEVISELHRAKLNYIPYKVINKNLAKTLVISYCFPPYIDTAGNVMAKRIRSMDAVVDVLYNDMEQVRKKDSRLNILIDDCIDKRIEVSSASSFSNWKAIKAFCDLGIQRIDAEKYDTVYSRVMWPASHFLAYKYKVENPKVKWVAEFSDPIIYDVEGKVRIGDIEDKNFLKEVNSHLKNKYGIKPIKNKNLFFWCECLVYLFADEIIFTNENQYRYMVEKFPYPEIVSAIKGKSKIIPQPTLPKKFYSIEESNYIIDNTKVNIAYFGAFYSTRNLEDLFLGIERMDKELRGELRIHIFTSNPDELAKEIKDRIYSENIIINPYVVFFEFLNLTLKFDCLVVNDAQTTKYKFINPYLPSKLSDYLGSQSKIWGIYEKGSVLSKIQLNYKSELGNIEEAKQVFEEIVLSRKNGFILGEGKK